MNAPTELAAFRDFLSEKLSNGGADLSPEEALAEWREAHSDPFELEDDLTAIKAALQELADGERGTSFEEFDREIRREFNFPPPPKS
jgi:hypothetical protein